jgi:hypothetical protein
MASPFFFCIEALDDTGYLHFSFHGYNCFVDNLYETPNLLQRDQRETNSVELFCYE